MCVRIFSPHYIRGNGGNYRHLNFGSKGFLHIQTVTSRCTLNIHVYFIQNLGLTLSDYFSLNLGYLGMSKTKNFHLNVGGTQNWNAKSKNRVAWAIYEQGGKKFESIFLRSR